MSNNDWIFIIIVIIIASISYLDGYNAGRKEK
jgi:hypothetical protein